MTTPRCPRCQGTLIAEHDYETREVVAHCQSCGREPYYVPRVVDPEQVKHEGRPEYGSVEAVCAGCGAPFLARQRSDRTQRYCGRECAMRARIARQREVRA